MKIKSPIHFILYVSLGYILAIAIWLAVSFPLMYLWNLLAAHLMWGKITLGEAFGFYGLSVLMSIANNVVRDNLRGNEEEQD